MGNGLAKTSCFSAADPSAVAGRHVAAAAVTSEPLPDDSHGHSFTYLPPPSDHPPATAAAEPSFFSLTGAAISANPATPSLSAAASFALLNQLTWPSACSFESSRSFAAVALQAAPPRLSMSGPLLSLSGTISEGSVSTSGPLSERPFMSGPLDRHSSASSSFSSSVRLHRSLSQLVAERRAARSRRRNDRSFLRFLARAASKLRLRTPPFRRKQQATEPAAKVDSCVPNGLDSGDQCSPPNGNVQWAQGMAGEDRFHVVVSEEHGWVFVGIYDGFSGPDATDFLFANLYAAVHRELKGVLWDDDVRSSSGKEEPQQTTLATANGEHRCCQDDGDELVISGSSEWNSGQSEVNRKLKEQLRRSGSSNAGEALHGNVLKALAQALQITEDAYFEAADRNPELALMGSCVLAVLMKGEDVYVMNVGDSRAVLAQKHEPDLKNILGKAGQDLERFKVEIMRELEAYDMDELSGLLAVQLTAEHSTSTEEEVRRIRSEHLDDLHAVSNGRVKGKLKVTRAFGAGYLKQPRWNRTLLEAFKIDYIGSDPYISCIPSLRHHRIGPRDRFLILSSDGLYQYLTNKEVVDQVEMYTATNPDGDPAQFLVEEVLLRAARKAGMEYHELLDIPQGDRRRYHDDVSIIIISLEGRIWRSSV